MSELIKLKITWLCFLIGIVFLNLPGLIAQPLAFPEAEGFGRFAAGGRGGDVYHVTNLNDDGVGSFRYGIEEMNGPRTIVFDVSGTIELKDRIRIDKPNLTIAGQTAPGDGITLAKEALYVYANDIIVRYIRCRLGDQSGGDDDAVSINRGTNIIFDHVTASWSIDETFSCQSDEVDSLTVQWCLISESLRYSHHEKGAHGYGGIIGSLKQSFHHNLYAHHSSRSPKVTWRQHTEVDFRNNVIYNWGYNSCYDGTTSYMNWANNYYKAGPATSSNVRKRIFSLNDEDVGEFAKYETSLYAEGNYVDGYPAVTADNWNGGIVFEDGATEAKNRRHSPHYFAPVTEQSAEEAYHLVVEGAGASFVRDTIDSRIAHEVLTGTTTYKGSKSNSPGIIDSQADVGGWPVLEEVTRELNFDTDQDGMPDEWELQNKLNPNNPDDRNEYPNNDGYTNLEIYLNYLVSQNALMVSVKTQKKTGRINCFPNPVVQGFSIDLRSIEKSTIEIYNLIGQRIYQEKVCKGIQKITTEEFSPGIYLVQVSTNTNDIFTEKIVIK